MAQRPVEDSQYRDGTTHIVLEPLDLMGRLAALVPPPRMHLTRFHGVFALHSGLRDPLPCGDELGAAPEAGVWDRDRALRPVRRHSAWRQARAV
jgi:Putative transposase